MAVIEIFRVAQAADLPAPVLLGNGYPEFVIKYSDCVISGALVVAENHMFATFCTQHEMHSRHPILF